eukprot:3395979-Lingulodinium_polyedra.AAC.1
MLELGWRQHPDFEHLLRTRTSGVMASRIVEDTIGYEKNNKAGMANRRFRRPLFSMHSALKAK